MADDRETIASLSFEQLLERARAGELESEYWRQVLVDLRKAHDGVHVIADHFAKSTLAVLGLLPLVEQAGTGALELIVESNRQGLVELRTVQQLLVGMLDLVDGRSTVLLETAGAIAEALGIELDDHDEPADV